MNWALRHVWKPVFIAIVTTAIVLLLVTLASAQTSQFIFDFNGNLLVQTGAISAAPQIIGQPQNRIVGPGESGTFSVVAANTRSLAYQWRFNGTNISGATSDALLLTNVNASKEGEYRVVLTNPSGSITSAPAILWIDNDGDGMSDSWEMAHFGGLGQTATSDSDGDGVSNLQEFLDATDPTDPNSTRYRLLVIRDGGSVVKTFDQVSYTNGESVTLTAIASLGGEPFHAWLGDIVTRDNPVTLVMTNNKTIYARFTPIDFLWTSAASGDWETATNWTPNLAPGLNDNVVITNGVTVALNTPADCAQVTIGGAFSPTLTGSGSLTVRGNFLWTAGTMSGNGRTIVESNATLTLASAFGLNLRRTLENGGTVLETGAGSLALDSGAVFTNRPGAVFELQSAGGIVSGSAFNRIDNAGTFRKLLNTGTTTIPANVGFNNSGTCEILGGALILSAGGTNTGSFSVAAGAELALAGGVHTALAGSSITGAGQFTISGGTVNLAGLVNISGSNTFSGGTANLTGNYICANNTLTLSGGTANFNGAGTVSPARLNLSNGTLSGSNTVTVLSAMNWTGGTMSGSGRTVIPAGVTLNAGSPSGITLTARTLENGGTVLWTGAGILGVISGGVITNRLGALFQVQNAATLGGGIANGRFDNAGTFRKSAHSGTTTFSFGLSLNNYGTVEIQTGTLDLGGGGAHSGNFDVANGTTLRLAGGTHTAGASSSILGAGQLVVSAGTASLAGLVNISGSNTFSGGTANLTGNYICTNNTLTVSSGTANFSASAGSVSPAVLNLSNGTLDGTSTVSVNTAMNWTGGAMSGSGRTVIPPGMTLNIGSPSIVLLNTRTLENGGTVLWTDVGVFAMNFGAVITNRAGALFHVQNASSLVANVGVGRFDNAGTFRKSVSTGTTAIGGGVSFTNFGTVDIRGGILAANGGYASSSNAILNCTLGGTNAGTGYGQLQVAGTVTLNGALSVDFTNGFSPALNDSFTVLTAGTRNGAFASFFYPSNAVSVQLSNTPSSVVLRVTNVVAAVPAPMLLMPELIGSNVNIRWTVVSNAMYRLEFNPDLANLTNWNPVPGDVTTTSNTASKLDPLTPSNRLYRVRLLP